MAVQAAAQVRKQPRVSNVRTAKGATERRIARKARAKYSLLTSFCAVLGVLLACAMLYVTLTAKLTSLSYAVSRAERERAQLQAQSARLDGQLAALESDERLARVAERLHMTDPQQFAVVTLPLPAVRGAQTPRLALLAGLAGLLRAK